MMYHRLVIDIHVLVDVLSICFVAFTKVLRDNDDEDENEECEENGEETFHAFQLRLSR